MTDDRIDEALLGLFNAARTEAAEAERQLIRAQGAFSFLLRQIGARYQLGPGDEIDDQTGAITRAKPPTIRRRKSS